MPDAVIRKDRVETNLWRILALEEIGASLPAGPIAVPLATWKQRRAELLARREPVGVVLDAADDPNEIGDDLPALTLVAVRFAKFTDGRGYSTAALLRTRLGYKGELRAIGDVGRDQLYYLARCGFDAFQLAGDRDPEAALAAFRDFTIRYQGSVDDPVPLFRRRASAVTP